MVLYGANSIAVHSKEILTDINRYRQDSGQELCDVTLKVGDSEINAHKSILSTSSQYFSSLFCGSYRDSLDSRVDLSAVTTDYVTLEAVISFIYIGEIEIHEQNIAEIVKLAAYFVLEQLLKFCSQFMQETLSKDTCLEYYILSFNHGLLDNETKSSIVLKSRLHDYVIYREKMLNLTSTNLELISSKGFFKYCSLHSIILYLAKWIDKAENENSIVAANKVVKTILDTTELKLHNDGKSDYNAAIEKLKGYGVIVDKLVELEKGGTKDTVSDTKEVVITISPKRIVVDKCKELLTSKSLNEELPETFSDDIFDLCLYVPSEKQWYYLQSVEDKSVYRKLVRHSELYLWRYVCVKQCLYITIERESSLLYVYNLQDFSVREMDYSHLLANLKDDDTHSEWCGDVFLTVCDNELYMIMNIISETYNEDDGGFEPTHNFNICYKLDEDGSWKFVCSTPKFPSYEEEGNIYVCLRNDEMVILFLAGIDDASSYYCIVDLNKGGVTIQRIEEEEAILGVVRGDSWLTHILIKGQEIHFIGQYSSGGHEVIKFKCNASHELKSVKLKSCDHMEISVGKCDDLKYLGPCRDQLAVNDGKRVWNFLGNPVVDRSEFTEVFVGENGGLEKREHPPPPFSSITAATAGKLDLSKLKLTPMIHYTM